MGNHDLDTLIGGHHAQLEFAINDPIRMLLHEIMEHRIQRTRQSGPHPLSSLSIGRSSHTDHPSLVA
ncbi:hypothetical protein NUU61_010015 [Penicillium alfredii]|uniref:Uncharacterized protein n=1 Tax=Penicillium alfredii TaxID=1506179 RepID=A0A9W9JU98_9EURO|nr:uncharacterized protein NUU61_010015 [Penicillium alfredii]KAJ5081751.1 hypothetical protein NUU61_010015 [Penicillium alfredii]